MRGVHLSQSRALKSRHWALSGQHWPGGTGAGLPSGQINWKQATSAHSGAGGGGGGGGGGDVDGGGGVGDGGGHNAWLGQQVPGGTGAGFPS